ncbi:MAG: serine hydrolase [Clostridia bacterium]|nr:serine hydrolase [Clostridia bacterium]
MKKRVKQFIAALEQANCGVEGVVLYQKGEITLNHRFVAPKERLIYSHTKSFVSTAAGMAIDEGKLNLDTCLMDLFPEYAPCVTDERVYQITLRDLLTMSSGFGSSFLMHDGRRGGEGFPDYLAYMLAKPIVHTPGERFVYSNADTHLVGCMVQRAVGEPLVAYLYRKLFAPLGIGYPAWESDPKGTVFGGSGLYLTLENMAKLGVLYLQDGVWQGERLLSHHWVTEAGKKQIATGTNEPWGGGYGYQFWTIGHQEGAFRADGAYGQFSLILPQSDAVVGIQSSEQGNTGKTVSLILEYLV